MIGRRPAPPVPPPDGTPTSVRLAQLTARTDQALAAIDAGLRTARGNASLVDQLLDLRLILAPPRP